jgi:hypothetical protein
MTGVYKLTSGTSIQRLADNAFIPPDPANTDYAAYLKWVEEGNTADEADPIPEPEPAPEPTLSELQAQLAAIAAQIAKMS